MKNIIIVLLLSILISGCSVILREDKDIRAIGLKEERAQEVLKVMDKTSEEQKTQIWPRRQEAR